MSAASETDNFSGVHETRDREWSGVGPSLFVVGFALFIGALGLLVGLIAELVD